ncbi:MAG: rhodanese-like domain-containing protein [Candidatus Methylacidiphilales bacterium]|nr:rhodanese-like domain-containing protein [Candidatus Methylacidiphilales bacterium]
MKQIDVQTLRQWREDGRDFRLVDVREKDEWELVRIEGSEWLPLSSFQQLAPQRLDPAHEVALICHHGVRSHHAGLFLERLGFNRVVNISGGIDAWAKCVDPTLRTY